MKRKHNGGLKKSQKTGAGPSLVDWDMETHHVGGAYKSAYLGARHCFRFVVVDRCLGGSIFRKMAKKPSAPGIFQFWHVL